LRLSSVNAAPWPERDPTIFGRTASNEETPTLSSQQRLLEMELKLADGTDRSNEGCLQVLDGLEERIAVGTIRRRFPIAQANPNGIQTPTQSLEQVVDGLQGHRRLDAMEGSPDGEPRDQSDEQLSEDRGGDGMAGQDILQEDQAGAAAASALAALGAVNPLAPDLAPRGLGRVVAKEQAVPVERLGSTAVATALLLERKTPTLSASRSGTNRGMGMSALVPSPTAAVETFNSDRGTANGGTQLDGG
jgi:hypothetical protein